MNTFKKITIRIYQKMMFLMGLMVKFREPKILNNISELCSLIKDKKNVLLLSGNHFKETDYYKELKKKLEEVTTIYTYTNIPSDPDIKSIEAAVSFCKEYNIDLVIGIGGGSTMDACKIICSRMTNDMPIPKMKGLLKIKKKPLDMILIPTTAGTGSECTVAAVVSDLDNNKKYAVSDPKLIPYYTLLDPLALKSLSPFYTATTGMDALTHAVEAYVGRSNTKRTKENAVEAIDLILSNLEKSYLDSDDLISKKNMQIASYKAGLAFTKAYVGYVHGMAHSIAAYYHYSHGYLNAIILPNVLRAYGKSVYKKLGNLAIKLRMCPKDTNLEQATNVFIDKIVELNEHMGIGSTINTTFTKDSISNMMKHCKNEVEKLYPVPCFLSDNELEKLYNIIVKN